MAEEEESPNPTSPTSNRNNNNNIDNYDNKPSYSRGNYNRGNYNRDNDDRDNNNRGNYNRGTRGYYQNSHSGDDGDKGSGYMDKRKEPRDGHDHRDRSRDRDQEQNARTSSENTVVANSRKVNVRGGLFNNAMQGVIHNKARKPRPPVDQLPSNDLRHVIEKGRQENEPIVDSGNKNTQNVE